MQFWEFEQALKAVYFIVRGLGVYPDTSVLQGLLRTLQTSAELIDVSPTKYESLDTCNVIQLPIYDWRKSKATDGAVCDCC